MATPSLEYDTRPVSSDDIAVKADVEDMNIDEKATTAEADESAQNVPQTRTRLERRFLWKLDICLLTWAWLAYAIKIIDTANVKTAYASGMKEDYNLYGNELNIFDSVFRVGYSISLIPSQLILTRVPARYWLPGLEVLWGIATALMAAMPNVNGMYALRFFIGVFEASSYPGITTILCAWYTPSEIATRLAIFGSSYPGANIFVSFMQAALHKNMDGKAGLRGYQWLYMYGFSFNGLMTVIVAAAGFFLIPDDPSRGRVRWLTKEERALARERVKEVRKLPPTRVSLRVLRKVFSGWVVYAFTLSYVFWTWSQNSNTWVILFLKAAKNADGTPRFGVSELNAIPIGGYVLQILAMLFFGWISDRTGWRATMIIIQELTLLLGTIILSCWPSSFGLKLFAFFTLWLSGSAGPILFAWMSDITSSPEERAVIIGFSITVGFAVDAFANIFIYPAKEAPNYRIGYKAASAFAVACIFCTLAFNHLERRTRARRVQKEQKLLEESELRQD